MYTPTHPCIGICQMDKRNVSLSLWESNKALTAVNLANAFITKVIVLSGSCYAGRQMMDGNMTEVIRQFSSPPPCPSCLGEHMESRG